MPIAPVTDAATPPEDEPRDSDEVRDDWVFICDDPGAVVSVSVAGGTRPMSARVVAFFDSGETLWFDAPVPRQSPDFQLRRSGVPGRPRLDLAVRAEAVWEPTEMGGTDPVRRSAPVPLILAVELGPIARPVVLDDAVVEASVPVQGYRVTGTISLGSVVRPTSGQVWSSRSGFATDAVRSGGRLQAVFQDDASLYAATTGRQPAPARPAALQVHHRISRLPVRSLEVAGPTRTTPSGVVLDLGERAGSVSGAPRHVEGFQHVAFLRRGRTPGEWVRVGYTPFDVVRSGTTGFGLLEHVAVVDGPDRPEPEPDLPDPWD